MKTVLVSVSDKTGLAEFLKTLQAFEPLQLIATGSTALYLQTEGFTCQTVDSITGFPEILEGRVKTLHPKVFGGILAKGTEAHQAELQTHGIQPFDIVIVSLYPFECVAKSGGTETEIIENIDIGGVALIRAAAKNFNRVLIVPDPVFYPTVAEAFQANQGQISEAFRREMALKAFETTAYYDSLIAAYLAPKEALPKMLTFNFNQIETLRYGENPQQQAAWYSQVNIAASDKALPFEQLQGKQLSANNIVDTFATVRILREFPKTPASCIIKHNNPCGAGIADTLEEAFQKAYNADPISAFGGVFGFNRTVSPAIAEKIVQNFVEIIIAPDFEPKALEILASKKNVRVLLMPELAHAFSETPTWTLQDLEDFGFILQESSHKLGLPDLTVATQKAYPETALPDIAFAWSIVKHLTSNAIVVVKEGQTIGFGIGQTSRIASVNLALAQAGERARGAILASDGFFPAEDNIEAAAKAGISIIVQPGGSIKDAEVTAAANSYGLAMALTHERCFKH